MTMQSTDIERYVKPLALNAFYLDEDKGVYKVAQENFEQLKEPLMKFLDDVKQTREEENVTENLLSVERIDEIINDFKDALDAYEHDLFALEIPERDFMQKLQNSQETETVKEYEDIKNKFLDACAEVYFIASVPQFKNRIRCEQENQEQFRPQVNRKRVVLNHNNPFADVNIKNQSFLYPDKNGVFKTLSFRLGHTMTVVEKDDKEIVALQPNFKISKNNNREKVDTTISFDDTLTTPMPETKGDSALLYL